MYFYFAFGLRIASDLSFVELTAIPQPAHVDIHIKAGLLVKQPASHRLIYGSQQTLFLTVKKTHSFLIEEGKRITYEAGSTLPEEELKLFLLGSCMGALLQQRGYIVLHGNAITTDRETCTVFIGHSGAGKSTLAASYVQRGAEILADDVCSVFLDENNQPWIIPSYPQIKLWQDAADLLNIDTHPLRRIRQQKNKFALETHAAFCNNPLRLKAIMILQKKTTNDSLLRGIDKLKLLMQHSYRYYFLHHMGLTTAYIKQLMQLAQAVNIKHLTYPPKPTTGINASYITA